MTPERNASGFVVNIFVVQFGKGSQVITAAKRQGISGGTILLAKGTIRNTVLKFLELAEAHREVVFIVSNECDSRPLLQNVTKALRLGKPNQGICFSIPILSILGMRSYQCNKEIELYEEEPMMNTHQSIFVIVDRGNAETVVEAATAAGARGATIINARGSGIHETNRIFNVEIEPEKEIVMILVEKAITKAVCESIKVVTQLDEPGRGILFVQNVAETYGLM